MIMNHCVWGFDASTLYTTDGRYLMRSGVDQSGLISPATYVATVNSEQIFYDRVARRLCSNQGLNLDEQGQTHGSFVLPNQNTLGACTGVADGANRKVFFACLDQDGLTIRSYDADTSVPIARVRLVPCDTKSFCIGVPGSTRVVRWGTDGLAVATGRVLHLYRGPFVH